MTYDREEYLRDKEGYARRNKKWREKNREWIKNFRRELRKEVINAYGGHCVCCGESNWEFLTLDHPNGNGQEDRAKHRLILGQLYGWCKKNNFPPGYQVLCMNCNWVRRFGGTCPHQSMAKT